MRINSLSIRLFRDCSKNIKSILNIKRFIGNSKMAEFGNRHLTDKDNVFEFNAWLDFYDLFAFSFFKILRNFYSY